MSINPDDFELRSMQPSEQEQVAELICLGTNHWYQTHGMDAIFTDGPMSAGVFCDVYEALDPGCCIVAVNQRSGMIAGSCFYHPRETHVSLGIMNVHPNYFGAKIASRMLKFVMEFARSERKPVRLVASAMNLDSFSLYTRAGFVPRQSFQDMYLTVPESGVEFPLPADFEGNLRTATLDDVPGMVAIEMELNHISRGKDFRHFVKNQSGIWHVTVLENESGTLDGFLVSVQHPGSNMLGPGVARTDLQAAALIRAELEQNRGGTPVFLIPTNRAELVKTMYQWGAKNCEIHFSQVLGQYEEPAGVVMPTFMPETG